MDHQQAIELADAINLRLVNGFNCNVVGYGTENYAVEIIGLVRDYPNYRNIRSMPTEQFSFRHYGKNINVFKDSDQ